MLRPSGGRYAARSPLAGSVFGSGRFGRQGKRQADACHFPCSALRSRRRTLRRQALRVELDLVGTPGRHLRPSRALATSARDHRRPTGGEGDGDHGLGAEPLVGPASAQRDQPQPSEHTATSTSPKAPKHHPGLGTLRSDPSARVQTPPLQGSSESEETSGGTRSFGAGSPRPPPCRRVHIGLASLPPVGVLARKKKFSSPLEVKISGKGEPK